MDINEVKSFIEQNADNEEVKSFVNGLNPVTADRVKSLVNEDKDLKSWFDSEKDKHLTKGIDTFKTNNLDKIYQERFVKENPAADPRDVELNKIKAEFENMKHEAARKDLTNKALKTAQDKKLPTDLIDYFIGADEETTNKNLEKFIATMAAHDEALKTELLKSNTYVPPTGNKTPITVTKEDFDKMTYQNRIKLLTENPELYKELNK